MLLNALIEAVSCLRNFREPAADILGEGLESALTAYNRVTKEGTFTWEHWQLAVTYLQAYGHAAQARLKELAQAGPALAPVTENLAAAAANLNNVRHAFEARITGR